MGLTNGSKVSIEELEKGILLFEPEERQNAVDGIFDSIPEEEKKKLRLWMDRKGKGESEKYYLTLLAVADAAKRRGGITRELMLEVVNDIKRGNTIKNVLTVSI